MRRKLEQFPSAATSRYPWDQLLDGDPWELIYGEDFVSRPTTFIANARTQARRRGGTVRTRLLQNGDRRPRASTAPRRVNGERPPAGRAPTGGPPGASTAAAAVLIAGQAKWGTVTGVSESLSRANFDP